MNKDFTLTVLLFCLPFVVWAQIKPITVNSSYNAPNEPSLAINPIKPKQIVAGANTNNLYISADGGQSWLEKKQKSSLGVFGDPVVYCNSKGTFFHAHLANNPEKKPYAGLDKMVVQRSTDGGKTWSDGASVGFNGDKMQDKEWLSGDENKKSPHYGNLYISWTEFDKYNSSNPNDRSRIRFALSSDDGKSFSEAITVSDTTGNCLDNDNTLEGATTAVGKKGEVYLVWAGYNKIWFDKSVDGGKSFGKDKVIAEQNCGWALNIPHLYRSNGMPFIACDPKNGNLYVTYTDSFAGHSRVNLLLSKDRGETWAGPLVIGKGAFRGDYFFPNLATNIQTGELAIFYYHRTLVPGNFFLLPEVCIISNIDSFSLSAQASYLALEAFPIASPGNAKFFGDYIDIKAVESGFAAIWTGFFNDSLNIRFAKFTLRDSVVEDMEDMAFGYDREEKVFRVLTSGNAVEQGGEEFELYLDGKKSEASFEVINHGKYSEIKISPKRIAGGHYEFRHKREGSTISRFFSL